MTTRKTVAVKVPADAGTEITLTFPGQEPVVLAVKDGKVSAPDRAHADQIVLGVPGAEHVDAE